jgi:sulfur-carrier protein
LAYLPTVKGCRLAHCRSGTDLRVKDAEFIHMENSVFYWFELYKQLWKTNWKLKEIDCMATVYIPTPLRRLTAGQSKVAATGDNVGNLLQAVEAEYPGVAQRVLDEDGNVKRFINIFVNDDEIRTLQGLDTPVSEQDRVSIVPAMAGGC